MMKNSISLLLLPFAFCSTIASAEGNVTELSLGKILYGQACIKCHDTAEQGAPRLGVVEDWEGRIRNVDTLTQNVISGPSHMPPKGGTRSDSSGKLKAVVGYMLSTIKGSDIKVANTLPDNSQKYQTLAMGKKLYNQLCYSCHDNGENGSPITGYMPHWQERIKLGKDALVQSVIEGKGMMLPKGGGGMQSKAKYASIVEYMLATVQDKEIANSPEMKQQVKRSMEISNGLKLYSQVCFDCHNTGKSGAPQLGDTAAWQERSKQDIDTLTKHAIDGHGLMGEKGGSAIDSIEGVKSMVMYMLSTVKN